MANILEQIVHDKRHSVARLKQQQPLSSFIDGLTPTKKDLYAALSQPNAGFILECKKASPSTGLIRADFDIHAIAKIYDKYAAAISVLTDEQYFQGSYQYLKIVTDTVSCPVLNKDFFIDPYQVYLARYYGADAILLMLSVLTDEQYLELAAIAERYDMAILTEISTDEERDRAIALGAKLIGINNRNLRDLSTDISRTFDYAPTIPDDRIIISESGIYSNAQVRALAPAVHGFLVGSSLMAQADIDLACRKLIFGNHKICGLTSSEQALTVAAVGARFAGLIFAQQSPRCLTIAQATQLIEQTTAQQVTLDFVGVFVDHDINALADIASKLKLFAIQLHGNEDRHYIDELTKALRLREFGACEIWKALPVIDQIPPLSAKVAHYLLDGKNAGSGLAFNWQTLSDSEQDLSACLLAGGIGRENIRQAIHYLNEQKLYGLDINSGVELSPGVKCSAKLRQVFAEIRDY